ncbi:hypothetical protein N7509_006051 [Penicillium cosmopolitanum]|uniref:DDHD domain-containing protein n=1 Tax=Penicillium cosmopolitanum TaxID=1131564 RepID=A0A9X0BAN7_9EURO|nr:uncharacterized protein N7509_006051 [Penicillium cosmopolitanum]KAJ5397938.1 hypothetical protein N7509_006051 [Penicillium cosmopolitanum]
MTGPFHTYGSTCLLADEESDLSSWYSHDTPPDIRSQFFYISSVPIDDPLAPLPPASGQGSENERAPPKPFTAIDNLALETSWQKLGKARQATGASESEARADPSTSHLGIAVPGRASELGIGHNRKTASRRDGEGLISSRSTLSNSPSFPDETPGRHLKSRSGLPIGSEPRIGSSTRRRVTPFTSDDLAEYPHRSDLNDRRKRERSSSLKEVQSSKRRSDSTLGDNDGAEDGQDETGSLRANRSRDVSISGSPFIRAPISQSHSQFGSSVESLPSKDGPQEWQSEVRSSAPNHGAPKPSGLRATVSLDEMTQDTSEENRDRRNSKKQESDVKAKIPVGASRLHLVELPNLKMKPIYWSPLHDVSAVVRATWFYKNSMYPVETALANKLEEGYTYLKPWTETWQDELNSCVENGADAELKIVHRLWTKEETGSANPPGTAQEQGMDTTDSTEDDAPNGPSPDLNKAAGGNTAFPETIKPYLSSSALYVDARNAQILRPSLLPSASRGRRPLGPIRKGRQIGIPVVRGFSRRLWDKLNPAKANAVDVRQYIRRNQAQEPAPAPGEQVCYACKMEGLRPNPTDLVLVIHGIGQKLSERMESFHFTHAMNAFRRQVNMELNNEPVWPHVDQDNGGIMVLPVNWRTTLSLEDPTLESTDTDDPTANNFSLDDITPQTLPAVRSLISDVMLDIPYYLSHHKPKMIRAVVREANRIYRLWCKNNPGFQENGRVHLLAHSLGSVMALDILSHQPTHVPHFDFHSTPLHSDIFEFDTRILFLCGSPAGFFLLLNKASLLPRKGRNKPGSEGEDLVRGVAGETGSYGCLAVDNLYNIMHTTDPITYRVNAAVDSELSNSLKTASIPSATSSFWTSFGSVFKWGSTPGFMLSTAPVRPAAVTKLPSNVEMETHDFTREEIAEKRMLLLNDNGQIDYYLSGGGGPLNIQYLNMLSAHSSYWTLTDFVRFFVVEIARKQGRDGTLHVLRAEKKKGWKYPRS